MKTSPSDFAYFGGQPAFAAPLRIAPPSTPGWDSTELQLRGIFERRYFANHGPLVSQLDTLFARHAGKQHAVSVANDGLALMILAKGLELSGEVIIPALCRAGTIAALRWAGLVPVPCDVDPDTGLISCNAIRQRVTPQTSAILGVHLWGRSCVSAQLSGLCEEFRLPLIIDATHGVAGQHASNAAGDLGQAAYFSFQEGEMLNAAEGACIVTDDETLANKLRTIKNFHPGHTLARVSLRTNGKMSEAQAALALVGLEEMQINSDGHQARAQTYARGLESVDGIRIASSIASPQLIVEVDPLRFGVDLHALFSLLKMENLFAGKYSDETIPIGSGFRNASALARHTLRLPCHPGMTNEDIDNICLLLRAIADNGNKISRLMEERP